VKYWEIIADNLSEAGWSWGCVSAIDSNGRTIFIADAHRDDGKRFAVRADEKLTAFVELESAIRLYLPNPRNLHLMIFTFPPKNSIDTARARLPSCAKLFKNFAPPDPGEN